MTSNKPSLKGTKVNVDPESRGGATAEVAARFQVQSLLGEGGMGSVFVAQDRGLGRIVALKRLREGLENDRDAMRRFVLEAQIGAQLEHPNIVPLYSFEHSEGGAPAITMQLLEGMPMSDYIYAAGQAPKETRSMRGEYSLKERIGRLLGVCEAIHFAHERGVIHRDLKPDNVMLGRYHEVYVMDWGLARVIGSPIDMALERSNSAILPPASTTSQNETSAPIELGTQDLLASLGGGSAAKNPSTATRQGEVMGTPQYMPPEQALGLIDQIGPAADQYALAVMLQELATLRPARSHTSVMKALTEALQNHLEPAIDLDGRPLHPALAAIVARATAKEPEQRYPTVRAMTDDLQRFVRDEPVSVFDEGTARRLVRAAARRPALAMAIFSVFGFLTSVAIVGAVVHSAQRTAQQAREMENTRRALVAVSSRAHAVEVQLGNLAARVQAIGAATVELLARSPNDFDHAPRPLPPLAPFEPSGGAPVSFEAAVITWPDKSPAAKLPATAAKLTPLERWLRACVVDALPSADRRGSIA
ncbi:MAG TPA: serine/threonine-protein kinase, partial [Polyangiaceae bacterium]